MFLVMYFGLKNTTVAFMSLTNGILKPFLICLLVFSFYDIFVYSKSNKNHETHLWLVFGFLKEMQLYVKC